MMSGDNYGYGNGVRQMLDSGTMLSGRITNTGTMRLVVFTDKVRDQIVNSGQTRKKIVIELDREYRRNGQNQIVNAMGLVK